MGKIQKTKESGKLIEVKSKGGRPLLQLDERQIFELAKLHCTRKEIAAVMDCSIDTLDGRFSALMKKGRENGRMTLRKYMWKSAQIGNVTMQIWLSKQLLDMHEPQVVDIREEAKSAFNEWYDEQTKRADNVESKRQTDTNVN